MMLCTLFFGISQSAEAISKAKCIVQVSSVFSGGGVYVSDVEASSPSYEQHSEKETSLGNGWQINLTHHFYLYAEALNGYRFEGWFNDDECTKPASTDVPFHTTITGRTEAKNATKTYYAKFVKLKYSSQLTVVASLGGTASADKEEVLDSEDAIHVYNLKAEPEDGYEFVGWYSDPEYKQAVGMAEEFAYNLNATREDRTLSMSYIYAKFEKKTPFPKALYLRHHTEWNGTPMAREIIDDGETAHYFYSGWVGTNVEEGLIFNFTTEQGNNTTAIWGPSESRLIINGSTPCTDFSNTQDDTQCYVYPGVNNFATIDVYISSIEGKTRIEVSNWIPDQEQIYMTTASLDWTRDASKVYQFQRVDDGVYHGIVNLRPYPEDDETARFFLTPDNGDDDDLFGFATVGQLLDEGEHAMAYDPAENFTLHRATTSITVDFNTGKVTLHWINPNHKATIRFSDHEDFSYGSAIVTLYDTEGNPYDTKGSQITGHSARITGGRLELRNASSWNQGSDRLTVYGKEIFGVVANDYDASGVRIITSATTETNAWFGPAVTSFQVEGINTSNSTFYGDTHVGSLTLYRKARARTEYGAPLEGFNYTTQVFWEALEAGNSAYKLEFRKDGQTILTVDDAQIGQVIGLPEFCDSLVVTCTNADLSFEYDAVPVHISTPSLQVLKASYAEGRNIGFYGRVQVTHVATGQNVADVFVCDSTDTHFYFQRGDGLRNIPVGHYATISVAGTFDTGTTTRLNLSGHAATVIGETEEGNYLSKPYEGVLGEAQLFRRLRLPMVSAEDGVITYNGENTVNEGRWTNSLTGLDGVYSLDGIFTDDNSFQVISFDEMIDAPIITNDSPLSDSTWFYRSTIVTITGTPKGTIYYQLSGENEQPTAYTEPFELTATTQIQAWIEKGNSSSPITEVTYHRYEGFEPEEGKYYRIGASSSFVTVTEDAPFAMVEAAPHRRQAFQLQKLNEDIPNEYKVLEEQADGTWTTVADSLVIALTDTYSTISIDDQSLGNDCVIEEAPLYECQLAVHPSAGWGSFIAPYEVEIPVMAVAYTCQQQGDALSITKVIGKRLEANVPYLVFCTELIREDYSGYGTALADTHTEGALTGTFVDYVAQTGDYVLQAHPNGEGGYRCGFYRVSDVQPTVKRSRCYIASGMSTIQGFLLPDDGDDATGILPIADSSTANDIFTSLNGIQYQGKAPRPGIYVVGGKRVIVK